MSEKNLAQLVYGAVRKETERLLPQFDDPRPEAREAAAEALGRIGSFEAAAALIRLLDDRERRVRWAAAGALGDLGSADAVPALVQLLEDKDVGTREAAAQALGAIGSHQAVEPLMRRLNDPASHVRLMAIEALGQIGSPEVLPALEECAKSKDESEQLCAKEAIELIRSAGAELLEDAWEEAPAPVLSDHPSLARFAEGLRGAWEPWEVEHVKGCEFCQRLVAAGEQEAVILNSLQGRYREEPKPGRVKRLLANLGLEIRPPTSPAEQLVLRDRGFRLVLIPPVGAVIAYISGFFGPYRPGSALFWAGLLWAIFMSFVLWHANRRSFRIQRQCYDGLQHRLRKMCVLLLINLFLTVPLTWLMLKMWYFFAGLGPDLTRISLPSAWPLITTLCADLTRISLPSAWPLITTLCGVAVITLGHDVCFWRACGHASYFEPSDCQ